jgi:serine/threonine-protein kinase
VPALKVEPGQILDGRFRLRHELGRGGMSILYLAEDLAGQEQVVVKVPLPIFSSGVGSWSLFQQEEEIGRQLDHPSVLRFLPLTVDKRRSYIVTEYVPGKTLAETLSSGGPLPEKAALAIASQICAAVAHMHERGFVHYDLKPANIILCPDGTLRLIDLGLAHAAVSSRFAFSGSAPAIASAGYLAPEQIRRKRGRKSVDIYGIGAILYEMLTGKIPFPEDDPFTVGSARLVGDPQSPRAWRPQLSPQVEEIVLRCLRRDPSDRYPSAAALKADLDRPQSVVVTGLAQHLQPPTSWRKFARKARYVFVVCGVPLLAQIILFVLLWRRFSHKG